MTISIGTSVNLNINLWGNGVFPPGCSSSFYLSRLGVCSYLLKYLWQALCKLHLTFTSGIIFIGILSETFYAVVCVCVSNLSLSWVLWLFLTVCHMERLCFLGLARVIECKLFHAGIFVKSVLPPESPASPFYRSPLRSRFLEHHVLSGLWDFMCLLCLVIIFLVSAEQPRLPGAPADTGYLVLGSCSSLALLLWSLWFILPPLDFWIQDRPCALGYTQGRCFSTASRVLVCH